MFRSTAGESFAISAASIAGLRRNNADGPLSLQSGPSSLHKSFKEWWAIRDSNPKPSD